MKRKLVALILSFAAASASAYTFQPGTVLTAASLDNAFASVVPLTGGTITGPLTANSFASSSANITGGTISGLSSVSLSGASGTTGAGSVVLATSPALSGTYSSPFSISGVSSVADSGRSNNDNTPTFNFNVSEALNFTAFYATHYGLLLNATELAGGTGDRVGASFIQTCNATLVGKSCVGGSGVAVAGGSGVGNYTGWNSRVLVPAGLTGGGSGNAIAHEADVETHYPIAIRNALRVAGENQSGGTTTYGSAEDSLLTFLVDSGNIAEGFAVGIQFGENPQGYPQNWPIRAGGTLFQASNPNVSLAYGFDLTGSTAGFSKQAIALPQNTTGGGIQWGTSGTAGVISSTATTNGNKLVFSDTGVAFNNVSNGTLLSIGGASGVDFVNYGYLTEASLTGYVYCNGSGGRCAASNALTPSTVVASGVVNGQGGIQSNGVTITPTLPGTTGSIGGSALAAGACATGTVAVVGATTGMVATTSPVTTPGAGFMPDAYVSAAGTVTVRVCATVAGTPAASAYNVRVLQ